MYKKILIIDNFDSFTYNVKHLFDQFCTEVTVKRANTFTLEWITKTAPDMIILSPGPGHPENAVFSLNTIQFFRSDIPIFGICLGMQCMAQYYGGTIESMNNPVHGKTQMLFHKGKGMFTDIPQRTLVGRYHSLYVKTVPDCFIITAWTEDRIPMAIRHKKYKIFGVQFHPESFLSENGAQMVKNIVSGNF